MLEHERERSKTKLGRPTKEKVSDSTQKVSDSTPKVSDSTRSDSSLSIPIHPMQQQQILQTATENPAKKKGDVDMTSTEDYKKRTEEALFASLECATIGYAHTYPEDIRPVVERMEKLWWLRAPVKPKKGGGQYALWVESCRALLDACGEFGASMLDDLRKDWEQYNRENGGLAPHTVSSPKSLINSAAGKAALLRQGITASQWGAKKQAGQAVHQSTLDV